MDQDRIKGRRRKAAGSLKEAIGKVTGDTRAKAEGAAQKRTGKVQNEAGRAKDGLRNTIKT